jgi:predicted MFS family arabinose efflux permease
MTADGQTSDRTAVRLVALVCAAQVLVQLGAFFWPALLPGMMTLWKLTNSEAGWITAIFYAAYMVSVPVLVTLTDRIDARRVYLFGVGCTVIGHLAFGLWAEGFWSALGARALTGMGWAGTYMTGLKLLADKVDAKLLSRATTGHAASIGISGAISFACADLLAHLGGWQLAFLTASTTALLAWVLVILLVPRRAMAPKSLAASALFDFRPVFRNRSSMAYGFAYCVHTLEMNALRGWGVAFLGFVATHTETTSKVLSPTIVLTVLGLIGTLASVLGNEAAIRFGRRKLIALAMTGAIVMALALGVAGSWSYGLAIALMTAYTVIIWLDSSSLTAGAAGTAEPSKRGATLAVHSMLGYAGGFVGPLAVGWTLDAAGGASPYAWGLAFALIAALMGLALAAFWWLQPRELAGDKGAS